MDPITASLLISGGGTLLGLLGGNDKTQKQDPFPGYSQDLQELLQNAKSKMNTPGTTSGINYNLNQSDVAGATNARVLGQINNPSDAPAYSQQVSDDLYKAQKAKAAESYADENYRQKQSYNRLGLASSTPYLQASQDLGRRQSTDEQLMAATQGDKDYSRQLDAYNQGESRKLQYLGLGNLLGQQDVQNQEYTQGANYNEFARAQNQPLQYAQLAAQLLGGAGQPYYPQETPSTASQVGMAGQDIGSLLLMYSLLGKK